MKGSAQFQWQGQTLELLPERAVWDPQQALLLLADLHLGKAESFQAFGIPLPSDGDLGNLNRLLTLADRLKPQRVLVLGDLIHSRAGLTAELREKLVALPDLLGCSLELIGGNHDRGSWFAGLEVRTSGAEGLWWLSHEPETPPAAEALNLCGHIHPVAVLGQGSDRLRLPCFALDHRQRRLLLPAFGELTGGHPVGPELERWLIAEGQVLTLGRS